jgi:glycosyltransferase involved in cell wall biosynthesis
VIRRLPAPAGGSRRVAFLHDNDSFGGMETLQIEIIRHLDATRYEPTVVLAGPPGEGTDRFVEHLDAEGVPYLQAPSAGGTVASSRGLARLLARERFDVAHLQTRTPLASRTLTLACALARVPGVVRTEHVSPAPHADRWTKLQVWPFDLVTDVIMTDSKGDRRQQIELVGRRPSKVVSSYCGIEASHLDPAHDVVAAKRSIGIDPRTTVIGTVGRLHLQKGHRHLVDAAALVVERTDRQVVFLLVGDGPEEHDLRAQVEAAGLTDRVEFAGHQPDPLPSMQAMDIVTMPSLWEGFSICMQQFMALGKPMVVSDHHSFREAIVHGEHGLIVPTADHAALADSIVELLDDPAQAARLGRAASERAHEEFSIRRHVAELAATYDRVLGRGPSGLVVAA